MIGIPKGIIMIHGGIGVGKTTYGSKIVYKLNKRIKKNKLHYDAILCNQPIKGTYMVNSFIDYLNKHPFIRDVALIIDESGVEFNNRKMKMELEAIMKIKYSRHNGNIDIVYLSQSWEDTDITIRRLVEQIWHIKRLPKIIRWLPILNQFSIMKCMIKDFDIDEDGNPRDYFKWQPFYKMKCVYRPFYYHMYNSWYLPKELKSVSFKEYQNMKNKKGEYEHRLEYLGDYETVIKEQINNVKILFIKLKNMLKKT